MDEPRLDFIVPELSSFLGGILDVGSRPVEVLDVGGGAVNRIAPPGSRVTVLDLSPDAVDRHGEAVEQLVGDAQEFDYGDRRFDVVIFWNVLEHVARPEAALLRACATLRDRGLVVLRGPHLDSLKALATRWTPHAAHVAFYKHVTRYPNAGKPGFAPFPVEHVAGASPDHLSAALGKAGLKKLFHHDYVGNQVTDLQRFSRTAHAVYVGASRLLRSLTRGRLGRHDTEFVMVWGRY